MTADSFAPVDRLTEPQRQCLRLVYHHMTSKDIARVLGISRHTVDMRLGRAMQILSVATRVEAARLLAQHEAGTEAYERFLYETIDLPKNAPTPLIFPSAGNGPQAAALDRLEPPLAPPGVREAAVPFENEGWSNARIGRKRNDLSILARIGWIVAIAIGSAIGFGGILAGLEALKQLL